MCLYRCFRCKLSREKYPLWTPLKRKENLDNRERISAGQFETVTKLYLGHSTSLIPLLFVEIQESRPVLDRRHCIEALNDIYKYCVAYKLTLQKGTQRMNWFVLPPRVLCLCWLMGKSEYAKYTIVYRTTVASIAAAALNPCE